MLTSYMSGFLFCWWCLWCLYWRSYPIFYISLLTKYFHLFVRSHGKNNGKPQKGPFEGYHSWRQWVMPLISELCRHMANNFLTHTQVSERLLSWINMWTRSSAISTRLPSALTFWPRRSWWTTALLPCRQDTSITHKTSTPHFLSLHVVFVDRR